jgi:predicted aspartyl protease
MQRSSRVAVGAVSVSRRTVAHIWNLSPVHCFLVLLGLLCALQVAFADAYQSRLMPFRLVHDFAVIVPVTVNGHGPYDFMLDTGSTVTAVDRELGQELGLQGEEQGTVTTLTQRLSASIALVRQIGFGPITEQNIEVMVRDLNGLRHTVPTARGVLGQNALNHADFLLDYQHKRLQFDVDGELVRLLSGHHVPLRRETTPDNPDYANLAVHGSITENGVHPMEFLLDSGAASPVIFGMAADAVIGHFEGIVVDTEGRRLLAGVHDFRVEIDGKSRELVMNVLAFQGAGSGVGGLLPTRIFSQIYISNSGGFAIFDPKMKKSRSLDPLLADLPPQPPGHGPKS